MESVNIFRVESLAVTHDRGDGKKEILSLPVASLYCRIDYCDPLNGKPVLSIVFTAEGSGYSTDECVAEAVKQLLLGKADQRMETHHIYNNCVDFIDKKKLHGTDFSSISGPLKELFENLFDKSKWQYVINQKFLNNEAN